LPPFFGILQLHRAIDDGLTQYLRRRPRAPCISMAALPRRKHGEACPRASVSESSDSPTATASAGVALSLNGFVAVSRPAAPLCGGAPPRLIFGGAPPRLIFEPTR
jgi:hypothetical protein